MVRFILGVIAGGFAVLYWGDQLRELAASKTKDVRKGAADTLQSVENKAGNVLDMAKEQVSSVLQSGQEAIRPSPTRSDGEVGTDVERLEIQQAVREELQRGFILHRFDQCLGGAWVGLAVFSVAFGLFHLQQGFDVAIAVGLLGVFWGVLYIRRRSVVMAMTSHAGFDVAEVLQQLLVRTLST